MPALIDWIPIRTEYITTTISTRALAQKHGLSYCTLRDKCARDGWPKAREAYTKALIAETERKAAEAAANVVGDRLADITEASMKAVRLMTRHLENMERTGRVKPYEVKAVTDALKNVLDVYKRLEENDSEEAGDDGLAGAMAEAALRVCAGGDDSGLLPDAPEEDGHGDP